MIDWAVVGTAVMGIATGIGGWFAGRGKRQRESARDSAAEAGKLQVIDLLRSEVDRISQRMLAMATRIEALEQREGRMVRHIFRLEGVMRAHNIEPPPFDVEN